MKSNLLMVRLNIQEGFTALTQRIPQDLFQAGELDAIFVIKHMGKNKDNPHYHIALTTSLTSQTLRARLKIYFGIKGNGAFSLKKWDGDPKFIQYCLHECKTMEDVQANLMMNTYKFYTPSVLEQMLQNSADIQDNLRKNTPKKIMIEIYNTLSPDRGYTNQCLFRAIMKYYIARGDWLPNKFQAERYINYLRVMINEREDAKRGNTQGVDRFIDELYENYFLRL